MKNHYHIILLSAVGLLFNAAPTALASDYKAEINPTPLWSQTTGCPTGSNARSMAVSSGRIYTVDYKTNNIYYTEGAGWKTIDKSGLPSGVVIGSSFLLASDDNGALVIPVSPSFPATTTNYDMKFILLKPGAEDLSSAKGGDGNLKYLTIPTGTISNGCRIDFMSAAGKLRTAGGGWLYFYPSAGSNAGKLVRVKGVSSTYANVVETYSGGLPTSAVTALAKGVKDANGNDQVLIQTGGNNSKAALYSLNGGTLTVVDNAPYTSTLLSGTKVANQCGEFYVYPGYTATGWNVSEVTLNVKNIASGEVNSVKVNTNAWSASSATCGMWVDAKFDASNPEILYAYCYIPGQGAWKYQVNLSVASQAPDAPANVTASVITLTTGTPGRQDAVLKWDAVANAAHYAVARKPASAGDDTWQVIASKVTDLTYTDIDVTSSFCYRVTTFSAEGIESNPTPELLCEPRFIPHEPEWEDMRVYDYYAKLQLLWDFTYGYRPDAYDIIRDGEVIAKDIPVMNFIDRYIPTGQRKYEIASVYYIYETDADGKTVVKGRRPESARSSIKVADVLPRNTANELYGITELYNYEITKDSPLANTSVLSDFIDQNLYRQAAFHEGKWYIAQRQDRSDYAESTSGGIICVDANAGSAANMAATAKKIYTTSKGSNVGIAVDDEGTFFIRNGAEGQYEFAKPVTSGRLLRFNNDLSVATDKVIDLSGVKDGGYVMTSRADYYTMKGDVLNGKGKLYFAPSMANESTGKNAWIVDIANGAYKSSQRFYSHVETQGGVENFLFPLDQRDDVLHLVRSSGYYRFNPTNSSDHKQLYKTFSRINNAGGASLWFNNHMLIITPQSQQSKNIGGFLVAKGTPDPAKLQEGMTKAANPEDVLIDYDNIIPVQTVVQKRNDKIDAQNSNGLWFGLEPFYNEDGSASHVDIYLYIPGMRFAKYRLYPFINMPTPQIEMNVDIQYNLDDDGNRIDITSFKGVASWNPVEFHGDISLKSYNLQFMNMRNEVVAEHWFDKDGNETDANGTQIGNPKNVMMAVDGTGRETDKFSCEIDDLDSHEYQARLTAKFDSNNDSRSWISEPSVASDMTDYEPDAPVGQIKVIKENKVWSDKDDKNILRRNYRLDIDFNAPEFNSTGVPYPVTYYELWYRKPGDPSGTYPNRLDDFAVMNGDGKVEQHQDVVAGQFDFDNAKRQVVDGEGIPVVCCRFFQPQVNSDGELLDPNDNPANYEFVVRAKYAALARNKAIAKDRESLMATSLGGTTGVDEIADGLNAGNTAVYPSLTEGPLTISAHEPIESVAVYGADGSLVRGFAGQGVQMLKIDLSGLHPGLYMVSVNGGSGHKIVKR